jgi:hypothetical protein
MIDKFKELFKNKYPTFEKEIRNIPQSCCTTSEISVFSFDEIKTDFYSSVGLSHSNMLKSVDALFFAESTEELYLIEMKGFGKAGTATLSECKRFIKKHFQPSNLPNKIIDTVYLIASIIGFYDIDKSCYKYFVDQKGIKIKTVLLSNFTNQELLDLNLATLHNQNISLTKRIVGEIGILNCENFTNHFKRIA